MSNNRWNNVIVKKPWGYEYLMYQNNSVGMWCLHIRSGEQTSLHCHPAKKTGLILLSGEADVKFFNDSVRLRSIAKLMLRPGLFHSTAAISSDGIVLLEIETPPDKNNLVRLEDVYGREDKPYEGADSLSPLTDKHLRLHEPPKDATNRYQLHGCTLIMGKADDVSHIYSQPGDIMVVLDGGLSSSNGESILSAGDVVTEYTINRLAKSFRSPNGISFLTIRKEGKTE